MIFPINIQIVIILTHYYDFCDDGVTAGTQINLVHSQTHFLAEACSSEVDGEILNLLAEKDFSYLFNSRRIIGLK